jgi:hypothetical protein
MGDFAKRLFIDVTSPAIGPMLSWFLAAQNRKSHSLALALAIAELFAKR